MRHTTICMVRYLVAGAQHQKPFAEPRGMVCYVFTADLLLKSLSHVACKGSTWNCTAQTKTCRFLRTRFDKCSQTEQECGSSFLWRSKFLLISQRFYSGNLLHHMVYGLLSCEPFFSCAAEPLQNYITSGLLPCAISLHRVTGEPPLPDLLCKATEDSRIS